MKTGLRVTTLLLLSLAICSAASAQADPAAIQPLQLSAFGAGTGTWTGLESSHNLGITAGVDLGWRPFYRFYPSVEVRGTYPIDSGQVLSEKNVLYGFKAARFYGRYHPYADFLVGRDKVIYQDGGYINSTGTLLYIDSVSNVFSYGGGLDLGITNQFSLKVDAQYQRYGVPVTSSGHIYSTPVSVGIDYRFDFNHHFHYDANGQVKGYKEPPPPTAAPVSPSSVPDAGSSTPNSLPADTSNTSTPIPPPTDSATPGNASPATNTPPAKPSPDTPAPTTQPQ